MCAATRKRFLHAYKHDRRCPNCGRWGALGGFDWANLRDVGDWHEALKCTVCGHESFWFLGGMLPTPTAILALKADEQAVRAICSERKSTEGREVGFYFRCPPCFRRADNGKN